MCPLSLQTTLKDTLPKWDTYSWPLPCTSVIFFGCLDWTIPSNPNSVCLGKSELCTLSLWSHNWDIIFRQGPFLQWPSEFWLVFWQLVCLGKHIDQEKEEGWTKWQTKSEKWCLQFSLSNLKMTCPSRQFILQYENCHNSYKTGTKRGKNWTALKTPTSNTFLTTP